MKDKEQKKSPKQEISRKTFMDLLRKATASAPKSSDEEKKETSE
jgi:hypothetical protein